MANSKDRRKRRRLKKETPRPITSPLPETTEKNKSVSVLKRIPRWFYLSLVVGTLLVTLLEGYPWLSLQKDDSLNSQNPYKTMFVAANDGYVLITDVDVSCIVSATTTKANVL